MLIMGLTGGIGAGKNSVAKFLEKLGAFIIDADITSRELVKSGSCAWQEIVHVFGREILDENGEIDRKKLGKAVFKNSEKRDALNNILHPKIIEEEWKKVSIIREKNPNSLIVINAALLIESGNYKDVDIVVLVTAKVDTMIERMMMRDNFSKEEAMSRLNAQMPLKDKQKYADYVIGNDGSLKELGKKVWQLTTKLQNEYKNRFNLTHQ
ncbi:MAG: dephospho-CoA kinase [Proteobacteria bacterium]|nr:dephospho-CoA kinase [Pseudomonadota bacterium]